MSGFALAILLVLGIGLGGGLLLYALVRAEHDERRAMERGKAERAARRDTGESEDP